MARLRVVKQHAFRCDLARFRTQNFAAAKHFRNFVGGRWGDTWFELIRVLAKEKALRAPKLLRRSAEFAWSQRWWNMLSVAAQASFVSSLVGRVPAFKGGYVPRHSDVIGDSRYASGPAFSRLPLRG